MLAPHRNPLIYRERCVAFRPAKLWATLIVVFGMLALAFVYLVLQQTQGRIAYFMPPGEEVINWPKIFEDFSAVVLTVQFFTAFYICLGTTLDSIVKERQSNTHEFFTTLPISAVDKVIGLCVGANLLPLLLLVLLTPLGLVFGVAGKIPLGNLLWLYAMMASGFLAVSLTGVAGSSGMGKRRAAWLMVLLLLVVGGVIIRAIEDEGLRAVPLLTLCPFGLLLASLSGMLFAFQEGGYHFFGLAVPWQLCPVAFYLFLAGLSFFAAVRRLSRPSAPPLPRWGAVLGFCIFQFLLIGFLADFFIDVRPQAGMAVGPPYHVLPAARLSAVYLVSFFVVILIWGIYSTPGYGSLMQWVERRGNWAGRLITEALTNIHTPILVPVVLLWGVTVVAVLGVNYLYWLGGLSVARLLLAGGVLLIFLLAYVSVFLLANLLTRRGGGPIGILLLALAICIPLGFSSIKELEPLASATAPGLFAEKNLLGRDYWLGRKLVSDEVMQSIVMGSSVLVLFVVLCAWRFEAMLRISPLGRRRLGQAREG